MHLIPLSVLLLAPWTALAAPSGDLRALPWRSNKRDSNLLNLPYPPSYSAASCSRASTNLFRDHGLVPQQTLPGPFLGNGQLTHGPLRIVSPRALQPMCRQIGSFVFTPAPARTFQIQRIQLQPGSEYVLSVAANCMVQYLSAFSIGTTAPFRHGVTDVEPLQNAGTLHLSLDEPSDVFFFGSISVTVCVWRGCFVFDWGGARSMEMMRANGGSRWSSQYVCLC